MAKRLPQKTEPLEAVVKIVGVLATICGGAWVVYTYFYPAPQAAKPATAPTTVNTATAAGGVAIAGSVSGGSFTVQAPANAASQSH